MSWSLGQIWGEHQISTAIYAAVTVLPLAGIAAGAVEFAHYTTVQSEFQNVVAEGLTQTETDSVQVGDGDSLHKYVSSSLASAIVPETVEITMPAEAFSSPDFTVTAEARMRTKFLWIIGVETLQLRETVAAEEPVVSLQSVEARAGNEGSAHSSTSVTAQEVSS